MEKLAHNITNLIQQNNTNLSELEIKKIQFGLHCLFAEISKIIVYLMIFSLFSLTNYFLVSLFFFCTLRLIAGGYHENTYWKCFFSSFILFVIIIGIGTFFFFSFYKKIFILTISFIITWIYAPVDHPNKPILSNLRRKKFKYLSLFTLVLLGSISFLLPEQLSTIAIIAILIETLSLPVGYFAKKGV
ncbi:MAG: accessory gene regulator B family protein [Clostridiaceae bacterium]|nr:accessory gene regulator B family protein [Clostridiaceae bacterium]